ncbi:tRNA pseudouridine(65) synthase TruC [Moraxella marmotae]|uniref:tRNA pseudouridine(65) synthase TruC n=1 Tax=Moraxella marmotae TaxID=3344520 RepID=UPI0035F4F991
MQTLLQILYRDEFLVVVNKPAGMLVHRSWLDKHETVFVMQTLRDQIGQLVYPVHRLDRPTSGVLLFALSSEVARLLSLAFETHQVQKTYLAVVRGIIGSGRIDYPLKPRLDKIADKFANTDRPPENAITDYQVLATTEQPFVSCRRFATSRYSLVRLTPITGRKHQLRRHMKHIFHPIVGDTTHGDKVQNRAITANVGTQRLLLHAHRLDFEHPITGEPLSIAAPLDDAFGQVMAAFAWENWQDLTEKS